MFSLNTILSKGWDDFKSNPILLVPGLLAGSLSIIFAVVLFWAMFGDIMQAIAMTSSSTASTMFLDPNYFDSFIDSFNVVRFLLIFIVSMILLVIVSVFIEAGLTGMAKEAVEKGTTTFGDFLSYGAKYFLKFLAYSIVIGIIVGIPVAIIAIIFIAFIAVIVATGSIALAILAYFVFLILIIIVALIVTLFFYFIPYAIVIDEMGVMDSISKSYRIFMDNKGDVFIFILIVGIISFAVSFVVGIFTGILGIIPIVGAILSLIISIIVTAVLSALSAVWSTRAYYMLTDETVYEQPVCEQEFSEYAEIEEGILTDEPEQV
ncbi:hypothetical protein MmiEs2_06100 [Methanimicrococcus stummii]|uniref:DUF7847 domain-containing protein n=1 Tax=Methanimicrococcus stummii TaxID=3028294 RepID=A0AA96VA18_9EURY|nr:hypothetical protein [Methanimicrococcus sp. Es2]WNY28425.1 hypothetical protein MmiEs2_06100 [Methanimicrococcus sp. Es2]